MKALTQHSGPVVRVAAASALAVLLVAHPAFAQTIADPNSPPAKVQTETAETPFRPSAASRGVADPASDGESEAASDIIPRDDPTQDPEAEDGDLLDSHLQTGQRGVVEDGDLGGPAEPGVVHDGLGEPAEPVPVEDGSDPTVVDTRAKEDIEVFENPAAGYDPLLFQIEDIDPLITDRRPRRLFRIEPYDPVGIRIGSFVYFPDIEISAAATDNILQSPIDASDDRFAEIATASRLVSNWETHAVELRSTGTYNFHDDFPSEDDRAWSLEGRGRLDVTRMINLQGLLLHDFRQEGRSAIDASATGDRPDVTTNQQAASLNHRFNRLSLQLRGSHTDLDYSDTRSGSVVTINDDRDSSTTEEALRAKWEFHPTFMLFAEAEIDQRSFDAPAQADGILRDSDGERYRFGVDFGGTGEILRGEASVGWGRQTPDDGRLAPVDAFLFDANLAWRISDLTSVLLLAQTDIYDTTTESSGGVVSHTVGVELRHAFRRYLIGTAGVVVSDRDYAGTPLEETETRATLGAEYYVNREVILFGRYQHIAFDSNQPDGDWDENEIRLGVRLRR